MLTLSPSLHRIAYTVAAITKNFNILRAYGLNEECKLIKLDLKAGRLHYSNAQGQLRSMQVGGPLDREQYTLSELLTLDESICSYCECLCQPDCTLAASSFAPQLSPSLLHCSDCSRAAA